MAWSESCDCHDIYNLGAISSNIQTPADLLDSSFFNLNEFGGQRKQQYNQHPCPLAGLRAHSMAQGVPLRILKILSEHSTFAMHTDTVGISMWIRC